MSISKIVSRCIDVSHQIRHFEIRAIRSGGDGFYYNAYEILKPTRHFCMLASCIPDALLTRCLEKLDRDLDPRDREEISRYHGEALAAADIVDALAEDSHALKHALPVGDSELSDQSKAVLAALSRSLICLELKILELEAELNGVRSGNISRSCERQAHDSPIDMHPKERTSLLKMVLGMALEQYGYDADKRGNAVSQIATDLAQHGLRLSDDNIRNKLRVAWDELKDQLPVERP